MTTLFGAAHRQDAQRKPRIALMGEFSAGKSTLMNLLLGCDPMPVQITATRVPPVWVSYGAKAATLVRDDGSEELFAGENLCAAPMDGTALIRFDMDSDILRLCDFIDIPGISDPNLRHETWMELMDEVDCVIWCTHATQAWRQSEAALWEQIGAHIKGPNLLVVTQFDKLRTERDQNRVLARLASEAGDVFDAVLPIATLQAISAGVDETAWNASGGAALIEHLVTLLVANGDADPMQDNVNEASINRGTVGDTRNALSDPDRAKVERLATPVAHTERCQTAIDPQTASQKKVIPRRVRPTSPDSVRPAEPLTHGEFEQPLRGIGEG